MAVMEKIFIHPGEIYVTASSQIISTVLGSCIAIILWDSYRRVGGMNHFILPHAPENTKSCRYGEIAILKLASMMKELGCTRNTLVAHIAGGGNPVESLRGPNSIGDQNARIAREYLFRLRIPIIEDVTGGHTGRKATINISTGQVHIKELQIIDTSGWYDENGGKGFPPADG